VKILQYFYGGGYFFDSHCTLPCEIQMPYFVKIAIRVS